MVDEKLLWEGRPELAAYWLPIGIAGVLTVPVVGALMGEPRTAFPILLMIGAILGITFVARLQHTFRVTDKRIICKSGLLSTRTSEIDIVDIRSINVNQGFVQRMLNIGSLEFSTASGPLKEAQILNIKNPESLKEVIRRQK